MKTARVLFVLAALTLCTSATGAGSNPIDPDLLLMRMQARLHEHGEGVKKNVARAIDLYCKGARAGDAEAQFSLGWIYANGRGIQRQDALAAFFFTLAAEQGHEQAKNMLTYVGQPSLEIPQCMRPEPPPLPAPPQQSAQIEPPLEEFVPATPAQQKAFELVKDLAPKYGVLPRLALAVIRMESNFDPAARSPKNAQGLMQLIPETAARFNVARPYDPAQNVQRRPCLPAVAARVFRRRRVSRRRRLQRRREGGRPVRRRSAIC